MNHQHEIFQRFPINGKVQTSAGSLPTPYHVYDGNVSIIGGWADLAAVQNLLQTEQLVPVQTTDGRALMAIWVCDFTDASLGAHVEFQVSVFVSPKPLPPVSAHPLALLRLIALHPEVKMLCVKLWNNTPQVVAYNREHAGLDAHLTHEIVHLQSSTKTFKVCDESTGKPVMEGHLKVEKQQPPGVGFEMFRAFGLGGIMQVARLPWITLDVINPIGRIPRNAAATTYTRSDRQIVQRFNPQIDSLAFSDERFRRLGFAPQFINHTWGVKFIYLDPV